MKGAILTLRGSAARRMISIPTAPSPRRSRRCRDKLRRQRRRAGARRRAYRGLRRNREGLGTESSNKLSHKLHLRLDVFMVRANRARRLLSTTPEETSMKIARIVATAFLLTIVAACNREQASKTVVTDSATSTTGTTATETGGGRPITTSGGDTRPRVTTTSTTRHRRQRHQPTHQRHPNRLRLTNNPPRHGCEIPTTPSHPAAVLLLRSYRVRLPGPELIRTVSGFAAKAKVAGQQLFNRAKTSSTRMK